jgi:hypothetical protein
MRVTEFGCKTADKKQKETKRQRQVKRTGRRRINSTCFNIDGKRSSMGADKEAAGDKA